jgi:hypothetical protein
MEFDVTHMRIAHEDEPSIPLMYMQVHMPNCVGHILIKYINPLHRYKNTGSIQNVPGMWL